MLKENKKCEETQGCCPQATNCHCCGRKGHWIIKKLILLIVIIIIFSIGMKIGCLKNKMMNGFSGYNFSSDNISGKFMGNNMMFSFGKKGDDKDTKAKVVFGVISALSGNRLDITDNGNTNQVVISNSDTSIIMDGQEIALSTLKVGQAINVLGELDTENNLQAKIIQVSEVK